MSIDYLALPDKSYTKVTCTYSFHNIVRLFSYSCADIFCTSDSNIALEPSLLSGLLRELRAFTERAASLSVFLDFFVVILLSALYKSIARAAVLASLHSHIRHPVLIEVVHLPNYENHLFHECLQSQDGIEVTLPLLYHVMHLVAFHLQL